jgi:hypothetical protein
VASDKFINSEFREQIRRRSNMTHFSHLYEKEKIEYSNQKVRENSVKLKKEMAKSMLDEDIDFIKVMGLTEEELLGIQKNIKQLIPLVVAF